MSKQPYIPPTIKRNVTGVMNKFGRQSRVCDRIAGVPVDELLEAYGSPFAVGQLSDSAGNPVELPFSYLPETFDFNLVEIIFSPGNDVTELPEEMQTILEWWG